MRARGGAACHDPGQWVSLRARTVLRGDDMVSALFSLALLAAVAGPIALRLRRHQRFVTGRDGRLSTSTTLALAWTVILLWLLFFR